MLDSSRHSLTRTVTGRLLWMVPVRPDLQYIVKEVARQANHSTEETWNTVKRICRYLRGTMNYVMQLHVTVKDNLSTMLGTTDASWASGKTCRSTSGGVVQLNGMILMSWSRTQNVVSLSSAEAELLAMSLCAQETLFVVHLLSEMGQVLKPTILSDSSAALLVAARRGPGRMKHIMLRALFVQDMMRQELATFAKVHTSENVADVLTKQMTLQQLTYFRERLGIVEDHSTPTPMQTALPMVAMLEEIVQCDAGLVPHEVEQREDRDGKWNFGLVLLMVNVILLVINTLWCSCTSRCRRRIVEKRDVMMQSMTTYTSLRGNAHPRFTPLGEAAHGAWPQTG